MTPYKPALFIILIVWTLHSAGQGKPTNPYSDVQVGPIPELAKFKKLTKHEIRLDSLREAHSERILQTMLAGDGFVKGTPQGLIDSFIREQQIINSIHYRENRSRYEVQHYKNNQLLDKTENDAGLGSIGTECSCIIDGDSLKVRMGIWVFGGFTFSIDIIDDKFISRYWLDDHKRKIFKLNNADTLVDNILVPIVEQQLTLDSLPTYKPGQKLTGHFTFKTVNYLRAADFEDWAAKDEYSTTNMDTMYTKGVILFTCKVRPKLERDE